MNHDPLLTEGLGLTNAWIMGMEDSVIEHLSLRAPLRAAYLATMIVGLLAENHGQHHGMWFIQKLCAAQKGVTE